MSAGFVDRCAELMLMERRPTTPEIVPLVWDMYDLPDHGVGGHLHIVLDDGNLENSHIAWCVATAQESDCQECSALGLLLLRCSRSVRSRASGMAYERHYRPAQAAEWLARRTSPAQPPSTEGIEGQ